MPPQERIKTYQSVELLRSYQVVFSMCRPKSGLKREPKDRTNGVAYAFSMCRPKSGLKPKLEVTLVVTGSCFLLCRPKSGLKHGSENCAPAVPILFDVPPLERIKTEHIQSTKEFGVSLFEVPPLERIKTPSYQLQQ